MANSDNGSQSPMAENSGASTGRSRSASPDRDGPVYDVSDDELETHVLQPANVKSKARRSVIWTYYTDNSDKTGSNCNTCEKFFESKDGNTSVREKHLKQFHPSLFKQYSTLKTEQQESQKKVRQEKEKKRQFGKTQLTLKESISKKQLFDHNHPKSKHITTILTKFVTNSMRPYSLLEDPVMIELISYLEPKYNPRHRTTYADKIVPEKYEKAKKLIQGIISTDKEKGLYSLSVTTDIWTSRSKHSYISLTVHYVDDNFELKSFILENLHFPEQHTGVEIRKVIEDKLIEWGIYDMETPVFVSTDNAGNFRTALIGSNMHQICCLAHTIQLAIEAAKKASVNFSNVCARARAIVGHYNHSPAATLRLTRFQKMLGIPEHQLIQENDTRWNSEYMMLNILFEQRLAITAELTDDRKERLNLSDNDWENVEAYVAVLKKFHTVTELLSGLPFGGMSSKIPLLQALFGDLNERTLDDDAPAVQKTFARNLLKEMNSRFPNFLNDKVSAFATLVDPRYKKAPFGTDAADQHALTIMCSNMAKEAQECTVQAPSDNNVHDVEVISATDDGFWNVLDQQCAAFNDTTKKRRAHTPVEVEMEEYFAEPVIPRNNCPFKWWQVNKFKYPILARMAMKYLPLQSTQIISERLFSKAGNIVSIRRGNLKPGNVGMLTFLNGNAAFLEDHFKWNVYGQ